jgi:hypothetical protein
MDGDEFELQSLDSSADDAGAPAAPTVDAAAFFWTLDDADAEAEATSDSSSSSEGAFLWDSGSVTPGTGLLSDGATSVAAPALGPAGSQLSIPMKLEYHPEDTEEVGSSRGGKRTRRQGRTSVATALGGAAPASQALVLDDTIDRFDGTLPIEVAYKLLSDTKLHCGGARPSYLTADDGGRLFMERGSCKRLPLARRRRRKDVDKWKQGAELQLRQVDGASYDHRSGRGEVWLRTVYGTITPNQSNPAEFTGGEKFKYYMYELHYYDGSYRPPFRAENVDFAQGTLFHVQLDRCSSHGSQQTAPPVATTSNAINQGRLDLQLQAPDNRWLQLLAADGSDRGALMNGEHGPVLSGSSGDFAEYHKIMQEEVGFEEGEVVSIGPDGLSRNTKGARQLGVISRRMIVAGSRPPVKDLLRYDTVAFSGRVPVRLRGSYSAGDFVVPSGLSDGTAVAKSGHPSVRLGRTVGHQAQLERAAVGSGSSWSPSQPGRVLSWHLCQCHRRRCGKPSFPSFQWRP